MAREPNELAYEDYRKGMKYKDIAEKYGVSINTVKSWKTRYKWSKDGAKGVHTKKEKVCTQKEPIAKAVEEIVDNPELNDRQRLFCLNYIKCFNATKAYQKAYGCDEYTARVNGCRLLAKANVKTEIYKLKQEKMNQTYFDPSDIFQKYMDIAFSDITDFLEFGREEVPVMTMYGPLIIKDDETGEKTEITKVVNTVKFKESADVDGTIISEVKQGKDGASIKLHDRMKALDWLTDHMGMATEEQKARIAALRAKSKEETGDFEGNTGIMIMPEVKEGEA